MPGIFVFQPIEANLIHNPEWLTKMAPYCSFIVGNKRFDGQACKQGGKNPRWIDAITFRTSQSKVILEILSKEKLSNDDLVGASLIDLKEIEARRELNKWYGLFYKGKPAGEIYLHAAFYTEKPSNANISQGYTMAQPVDIKQTELMQQQYLAQAPLSGSQGTNFSQAQYGQNAFYSQSANATNVSQNQFEQHQSFGTSSQKFVEQKQSVKSHTFMKDIDVVETRSVMKEVEVFEPVKVLKDVQCTRAVPVKKQIETMEPHVVTRSVEVIEPRLVTKQIQVIENVPVKKMVEVIENISVFSEVDTFEPRTFTRQIEVTEQVPVMRQVTVTEPYTYRKSVEYVEPIITTKTVTKEMRPNIIIDEKITTEIGPANVVSMSSESREVSAYGFQNLGISEERRIAGERSLVEERSVAVEKPILEEIIVEKPIGEERRISETQGFQPNPMKRSLNLMDNTAV